MTYSRLSRVEEKKARLRLFAAILGSLGVIVFIIFFGLQILIGFSVGLDRLRGSTPVETKSSAFVSAPVLDQLPTATNSAQITISGIATSGNSVLLYLNDDQVRNTLANEAGYFHFPDITLKRGMNNFLTKAVSSTGQTSASSNSQNINYKKGTPVLEITEPASDTSVNNESNIFNIIGKTEAGNTVTINDRLVVVSPNGNFEYQYPLTEGDNTLKITSIDEFGNSVSLTRQVKYQKP